MPKIAEDERRSRRDDLVQAAWRCASKKGFSQLHVDDVCMEAGVSKGAFYGYFLHKQDLLMALLEDDAASLSLLLQQLEAAEPSPLERLERFAREMLDAGGDAARVQVRSDLWAAMLTEPQVRARFSADVGSRRATLMNWVAEGIRAGEIRDVPPRAVASILLALGDGLLLHLALEPEPFVWSNVQKALEALLGGLRVPAPGKLR